MLSDAGRIRHANRRLEQACSSAGPLRLDGVSLGFRHVRLGPGVYTTGSGAGAHRHDQVQLEYVISGHFCFTADDEEEQLTAGRGLVILPGRLHGWRCRRAGLMLGCLLDLAGPRAERLRAHLYAARPETLTACDGQAVATHMDALIRQLLDPQHDTWRRERIAFLLGLWLAELLDEVWPLDDWRVREHDDERQESHVRRADEFMKASCTERIRLHDVAHEVGLSVRHLNRLYRQERGTSLGAALGEYRLQAARDLIHKDPGLPLKAIAHRCGFASPAYFTACYRRRYGEPPSRLRRT